MIRFGNNNQVELRVRTAGLADVISLRGVKLAKPLEMLDDINQSRSYSSS